MPCRICVVKKFEILKFNAKTFTARDDVVNGDLLDYVFYMHIMLSAHHFMLLTLHFMF
jgi:hypothetical protein